MASPVDAGRAATTAGSSASANKACALPASIVAGDVLLLIIRSCGADTHTTPTNWTDLVKNNSGDASDDTTSIFIKDANGSEGTSVTVNATTSLKWSAIGYRVTGAQTIASQAPDISTIAVGTSTTPSPTAVTITGGPKDVLVLALGAWDGEQTSPPGTIPASYGNSVGSDSGTGGLPATNSRCAGASRQLTAVSSEDPGSWTLSGAPNAGWSSWAVAFQLAPPPNVTPGVGVITYTGVAPTVAVSDNKGVSPSLGVLTWTGVAPSVTLGTNLLPGVGAITFTGISPTVVATANIVASPGIGVLTWTGIAPTVLASDNKVAAPGLGVVSYTGLAPSIAATANIVAFPGLGVTTWTGLAPTVTAAGASATATPGLGILLWAGYAPSLTVVAPEVPEILHAINLQHWERGVLRSHWGRYG